MHGWLVLGLVLPSLVWPVALLVGWHKWLNFCREVMKSPKDSAALANAPKVAESYLRPLRPMAARRRAGPPSEGSGPLWASTRRVRIVASLPALCDAVGLVVCATTPAPSAAATQERQTVGGREPGDAGVVAWGRVARC